MKRQIFYPLTLIILGTIFVSCTQKESDLKSLLKKKNELRAELESIQNQINELEENTDQSALPLVEISQLEKKRFVHKIKVQGNVETNRDAILNAEFGGVVTSVKVKEGDRVKQGQILISLDAAMINASIQEIKTQLEYATYLADKQKELKNRGVGSEFDYKAAINQVNSLKSKLNSLELQRSKANITAPFSGIIDQIFAKEGQMASPQGPILRIVNTDEITISADLSEKHMQNIHVGSPVYVSFPNFNDTVLTLQISSVAQFIDPTNRTFRITAKVKNNKLLVPNMLASLEIIDLDVNEAYVVPSESILKDYNNQDYIFSTQKTTDSTYSVTKVLVKSVEKYNNETYIKPKKAIAPGTMILIKGAKGITETDLVRIN
jgi:membrane fusion protein, multidrug efflux system